MSTLTLTINKQDYQLENLDARTTLLDVCRQHLQITGPKKAATMVNAGLVPCSSMDDGSIPV
ncbi:hypothetical protein ACOBWA_11825 [Psychrobacter sp. ER1]|uniref:hypothetical protein n=1 Tax=Psychrobacter sp. ER1 TaxID=3406645 RepID=UPI003B435F44